MRLSPSLFFTTNCEPALDFYEAIGLGKKTVVMRHGDNQMPVRTEAMRGKIMHANFEGPGVYLTASDNDDAEPMKGAALLLELNDTARGRKLFDQMAEGGMVRVAYGRQPWGADFGNLTDRFGVQWMINCQIG